MRKEREICQPEILDFKQNAFFYGSGQRWGFHSEVEDVRACFMWLLFALLWNLLGFAFCELVVNSRLFLPKVL